MSLKIFIDGQLVDQEDAKVSVFDRGLLYGDGIFEGMRSYAGKVFRMKEHLDRLYDSARSIHLQIPISIDQMEKAVQDTLKANEIQNGYIRLIVTRGVGDLSLDPYKCEKACVIVIADNVALYPEEMYTVGLDIVTASTIRNHHAALNPRIKSLNYLNNILAKIEGVRAGCVEALMLNTRGEVAECTGDNIFIVKENKVMTPPVDAGILDGITRKAVMELAEEAGYQMKEMTLTRHDVYVADECFLTGSAAEVIPVVKIDNRPIGDGEVGPVAKDLVARFRKLVVTE